MGQVPDSRMYVIIVRFSNMCPDFLETTGSTGGSPDIAHTCEKSVRILNRTAAQHETSYQSRHSRDGFVWPDRCRPTISLRAGEQVTEGRTSKLPSAGQSNGMPVQQLWSTRSSGSLSCATVWNSSHPSWPSCAVADLPAGRGRRENANPTGT